MNMLARLLPLALSLAAVSCSHVAEELTVESPGMSVNPAYLGDGMEVLCYRVTVDDEELDRSMSGLGATLISSGVLLEEGLVYFDLPADRVEDFVSVISDGNAWNVRWFGQQFGWVSLLPGRSPARSGSLSLKARVWSTMLEDGPVVQFEAYPIAEEKGGPVPRGDLRIECRLRPGHCLVLMGTNGTPGDLVSLKEGEGGDVPLGKRLIRFGGIDPRLQDDESGIGGRDLLILLPRFTNARQLPPLRSPQ